MLPSVEGNALPNVPILIHVLLLDEPEPTIGTGELAVLNPRLPRQHIRVHQTLAPGGIDERLEARPGSGTVRAPAKLLSKNVERRGGWRAYIA